MQVCFVDRGGPRALTASSGVLHLGDCVRFREVSQRDWRGACIPLAGCRFGKISEVRFLRANRTGSGPQHDATPLACDPQAPWRLTALHNFVSVQLQLECADGAARLIRFEWAECNRDCAAILATAQLRAVGAAKGPRLPAQAPTLSKSPIIRGIVVTAIATVGAGFNRISRVAVTGHDVGSREAATQR